MNSYEGLSFAEKLSTEDGERLAQILVTIKKAIESGNIPLLATVYDENALIAMYKEKHRVISLKEYLASMSEISKEVRTIAFKNITMMVRATAAEISCENHITLYRNLVPKIGNRYFQCIKENGKWHIIKALYV